MTTFPPVRVAPARDNTKMLTPARKKSLAALFPGDAAVFDEAACFAHGSDASRLPGFPWGVVRPSSTEQVVELLKWAQAERVPLIPRGRGTGVAGAAVAAQGGLVVSLLRMNEILEVAPDDFLVRSQPGVITSDLQKACAKERRFYPPDPGSVTISTIGGNIATCAGGMRAVKYGVTRDWLLGLTAVLPGGAVVRAGGRCHKDVAGLDLTRLMIGSEGTLGVVTEATLRLIPLPEASASLLAGFPDMDALMRAAGAVFGGGLLPTAMEFFDQGTLHALSKTADSVPWPEGTAAALLLRLDGSAEAVAAELKKLDALLAPCDPTFRELAPDPASEERLWELRRLVSPALYKLGPNKLADDLAVPRGSIAPAVERFRAIGDKSGVTVVCFGHLGDGNVHTDVMYDASDPRQNEAAHKAKDEILAAALELRGTITGEHGVGIVKLPYLSGQIGEAERALMHRVKAAFDPLGIMNPGKAY